MSVGICFRHSGEQNKWYICFHGIFLLLQEADNKGTHKWNLSMSLGVECCWEQKSRRLQRKRAREGCCFSWWTAKPWALRTKGHEGARQAPIWGKTVQSERTPVQRALPNLLLYEGFLNYCSKFIHKENSTYSKWLSSNLHSHQQYRNVRLSPRIDQPWMQPISLMLSNW